MKYLIFTLFVVLGCADKGSAADQSGPGDASECCKTCGSEAMACGETCISVELTCHQPDGCACDNWPRDSR